MKNKKIYIVLLLYFTVLIFAADPQSISFFWSDSGRFFSTIPVVITILFVLVLHSVFFKRIRLIFGCLLLYIVLAVLLIVLSDYHYYYWLLISTVTTLLSFFTIHFHNNVKKFKKGEKKKNSCKIPVYSFTYLFLLSGYADIIVHFSRFNLTSISVRSISAFVIICVFFILFIKYLSPKDQKKDVKQNNKKTFFPTTSVTNERYLYSILFAAFVQNFMYALMNLKYYLFFYQWIVIFILLTRYDNILQFIVELKQKSFSYLSEFIY